MKHFNLKALVRWITSQYNRYTIILTLYDLNHIYDISGPPDDSQVCNCDACCIMESEMCIFFDILVNKNNLINEKEYPRNEDGCGQHHCMCGIDYMNVHFPHRL